MNFIEKLYTGFGKRTVIGVFIAAIALVGIGLFSFSGNTKDVVVENIPTVTSVTVALVQSMSSESVFSAVGTVEAVSEARLETESGGRITSVTVHIGDTIRAGSVLATLENNSERAALLQAEGAYEIALAGVAQSGVGESEAKEALLAAQNNAISTYKTAYTTVSGIVFGTIDQYFSDPNAQLPGLRLGGTSYTTFLNTERIAFRTILPKWQSGTLTLGATSNIDSALAEATLNTTKVLAMVDAFIDILNSEAPNSLYNTEATYRSLAAAMNGERTQLVNTLSAINTAKTGLANAASAVERAAISSGTNSQLSIADAQVKIALGALRAAQATYEKTLVRTPISGVVNALYLKAGEYVSPGTPAAIVANNNGLEIKTAVAEAASIVLTIGDEVTIDGSATGTISAIAGAIDPTTGKVAVNVSISENSLLKNGTTVSIDFKTKAEGKSSEISIPLEAIKMTGSGPVVFTIAPDSHTLLALPVTLGAIVGENVVVSEGITPTSVIVIDARGLKTGQVVTTVNN
jgi:RND family efflux transporter MFP subunit